jgi:thymidylate synthase (FAD)
MIKPVLDGVGFAELLSHDASDLVVVNAARVSYNKMSVEMTDRDKKLIRYLMQNRHGSPFEHATFRFRIKAPLFTVAQWQRHRMASYNQQSARWSDVKDEFYCPEPEIEDVCEEAYNQYLRMLDRGVPRERARICLPVGLLSTFWFTVNSRSLMNFLMTRNEEHAQAEIREYAAALEAFFQEKMPETHSAFVSNGRVAP